MKKKEMITNIYEHCGECGNCGYLCPKERYVCTKWHDRIIKDLWGEIPKWCPLEDSDIELDTKKEAG